MNRIGQRVSRDQSGTAFAAASRDDFTYNSRGEVVGALNDTHSALDFAYSYDDIGNRMTATAEATGPNPVGIGYTVNALNQYTEVNLDGAPLHSPVHDANGNMTHDGKGNELVWDGENRLIEWRPISPAGGDKRLVNHYDGQSRRIRRQVLEWSGGAWVVQRDEAWIYDGWNPVAVYDIDGSGDLTLSTTYTWGRDLSGSMQGAGGVGGLLGSDDGSKEVHYFYDGNGNVSEVLDDADAVIAHYEYDPFGNTTTATGIYAVVNSYRFSTKPVEEGSGFYYYGYRYYDPATGRWPSRDPIEEDGGVNLYGFIGNDGVTDIDVLGEKACTQWRIDYTVGEKKLPFGNLKFSFSIRGQLSVCDDCTKTLTGSAVGQLSGEWQLTPPWFLTASGDVRGNIQATWGRDGFEGGSSDLQLVGWFGGGVNGGVAKLIGEVGANMSWTGDLDADESSLDVAFRGGPIEARGRVRVKVGWGRWAYNRVILQVSGVIATAPDFDVSVPLPSTVGS